MGGDERADRRTARALEAERRPDHRTRPRRRGRELETAIRQATLAELAEVGYARLTMEGVAERAGTGKASLYRRWQSRIELVMDAVYSAMPDPLAPPDTGSLRDDVLALLRRTADLLDGPLGEGMRGILLDVMSEPERTAEMRRNSQGAGKRAMGDVVRRAIARGEVTEAALTPRKLEVWQAMIRQQFFYHGTPIPDELLVEIVDEVVLPVLTADGPPGGAFGR